MKICANIVHKDATQKLRESSKGIMKKTLTNVPKNGGFNHMAPKTTFVNNRIPKPDAARKGMRVLPTKKSPSQPPRPVPTSPPTTVTMPIALLK